MRVIYKYAIRHHGAVVQMHCGASIRHVAMQGYGICVWAEQESDLPLEPRKFIVVGTGQEIPKDAEYVGTVHEGPYVWHVHEVP